MSSWQHVTTQYTQTPKSSNPSQKQAAQATKAVRDNRKQSGNNQRPSDPATQATRHSSRRSQPCDPGATLSKEQEPSGCHRKLVWGKIMMLPVTPEDVTVFKGQRYFEHGQSWRTESGRANDPVLKQQPLHFTAKSSDTGLTLAISMAITARDKCFRLSWRHGGFHQQPCHRAGSPNVHGSRRRVLQRKVQQATQAWKSASSGPCHRQDLGGKNFRVPVLKSRPTFTIKSNLKDHACGTECARSTAHVRPKSARTSLKNANAEQSSCTGLRVNCGGNRCFSTEISDQPAEKT